MLLCCHEKLFSIILSLTGTKTPVITQTGEGIPFPTMELVFLRYILHAQYRLTQADRPGMMTLSCSLLTAGQKSGGG